MSIHVDTSVLIDLLDESSDWQEWSLEAIKLHGAQGLQITSMVWAEVSAYFDSASSLDEYLSGLGIIMLHAPKEALFLAAKSHLQYRRRGGQRTTTLPDFFIGAHAVTSGASLITRDGGRFPTYFPELKLITP